MGYTTKLKPHEKILSQLTTPEGLDELILSLLGISNMPIKKYKKLFNSKEIVKIPEDLRTDLSIVDLCNLPEISLNTEKSEAEGVWGEEDGLLRILSNDDYTYQLQSAIDNIYPNNKESDLNLVPVTILIPSSIPLENDALVGKKSQWNFIKLNNESENGKSGFKDLADHPCSFFGLRLFMALKSIGLVKTNQSSKNLSKVFADLIHSSPLRRHFKLINSRKLTKFKSLIEKEDTLTLQKIKLKSELSAIREKREKGYGSRLVNESMLERLESELDLIQKKLSVTDKEILKISYKINELDLHQEPSKAEYGFYYTLPPTKKLAQLNNRYRIDSDETFILPTPAITLSTPKFTTSKSDINKEKPSPMKMRRMRFMLSYLLPMTSGTAITFYINKDAYSKNSKGIKAPLLILPEVWNVFASSIKMHVPGHDTPEYEDIELTEENASEMYVSAIHAGFKDKHQELMRVIQPISDTSADDIFRSKE